MSKIKVDHWRQMDFYPPTKSHRVIVVGAGSIGSYVTFGLARMGVSEIKVVDYDKVESHNLPNQFFSEIDMPENTSKVFAVKKAIDLIVEKNNVIPIEGSIENVLPDLLAQGMPHAIIITVDNMKTRQDIFDILNSFAYRNHLIDGRVGGEFTNIYATNFMYENDREAYKNSLYADSDVEELPCTARSVIDLSMGVSAQLINRARHSLMGKYCPLHTFHDYKYGQAWVMDYGHSDPAVISDDKAVLMGGSDGQTSEN